MVSLAQREARNYQFDFLRPNHSLFNYFSKLVEQYTKILVPTPDMLKQVDSRANNKYAVQDIVMSRVEYTAYQQELRKKKDEKEDAERRKGRYSTFRGRLPMTRKLCQSHLFLDLLVTIVISRGLLKYQLAGLCCGTNDRIHRGR